MKLIVVAANGLDIVMISISEKLDVAATVEQGGEHQSDGVALKELNIPAVPLVSVESKSVLLLTATLQMRQYLGRWYPADPEEYRAVSSKEVASSDVLAGDLYENVDWESAELTGGPGLSN